MALTWSQVSDMAKTEYLPVVIDHIVLEDYIMKYIKKFKKIENVAYEFKKAYRYGYSEGTKMMGSFTEALANPGQASNKSFTGSTKWRNGVIKIYEPIAQLMKKDEKAFIDELSQEMNGIADAMKAEQERMAWGDGGLTPLATCAADATTSTASPLTINLGAGSTTRLLRPGMRIDLHTTAHAEITNGTSLEIQDVIDDSSFTLKVAVTGSALTTLLEAIDGALIYHEDGYNKESYGMLSLFGSDSNTIFGVDRSTAKGAWYRPKVYRMTANGLTKGGATSTPSDWELTDLEHALEILTMQAKAKQDDLKMFCRSGAVQYGIKLRQQLGEANVAREKIDLWPYKVPEFNGVPMLSGNYNPANVMFITDMSGFVRFEALPLDWSDMDGNMWKWVDGYAAYTAYLLESYELGHYTPWRCMTIYDVKQSY